MVRGLSVGGIERFVEPFAKWARGVTSPHTLYESVIRAGEMAQRVPKGPIYLNVALEHMLHDWTPPAAAREVPLAPKVQPRPDDVAVVADLLIGAKSPVIVAEASGRDPAAFAALVELADLLAIPVINGRANSYANFPTDHPLYQGVGRYKALEDADLVLLVSGARPGIRRAAARPAARSSRSTTTRTRTISPIRIGTRISISKATWRPRSSCWCRRRGGARSTPRRSKRAGSAGLASTGATWPA